MAAAAAASGDAATQAVPLDPAMPLPLPWTSYFDRQERVACPERGAEFNVYVAGNSGPVLLCLHGGGYTGLSWALIAKALKDRHQVVAPDLRGHGLSQAGDEADLAAATLAADVVAIWQAMFGAGTGACSSGEGSGGAAPEQAAQQAQRQDPQPGLQEQMARQGPASPQPTVLVGHSMGGAVAVHTAALGGISSLAGAVVIDVVEGTAIASLPFMEGVLAKRPRRFASLAQAVGWALDTGMCKRQEAAHISLPAMLVRDAGGPSSSVDAGSGGSGAGAGGDGCQAAAGAQPCLAATGLDPLVEEGSEGQAAEEGVGQQHQQQEAGGPREGAQQGRTAAGPPAGSHGVAPPGEAAAAAAAADGWTWRTPLERSAPYWEGWYTGLSDMFLQLPVPKVLVLVGTDRLDRPLTIGQMQGKFQPVLLPQAGHAVHEDEPERVADAIATFIRRFRIGEPPLAIPRPPQGTRPVLPVPMGPAFAPPAGQGYSQTAAGQAARAPPQ